MRDADVVLAIGSRLGGLVTDSYRLMNPASRIIHVDLDPNAFGGYYSAEVAINADARAFLEALSGRLGSGPTPDRSALLDRVSGARDA